MMQLDIEESVNIFKSIETYKELIAKKETEIEELETIKDSLTDSLIKRVRSIFIPYSSKMLSETHQQSGNKKKSERPMYEFMKKELITKLFSEDKQKDVKLEGVTGLLYDFCVYYFTFTYKGLKIKLTIPNVKVASKENLHYMWYGQYQLHYERRPSVWHCITSSYKLEDIAKALEEFIEKGENEDE